MDKNVKVSIEVIQFKNGNVIVQTDNSTFVVEDPEKATVAKLLGIAIMESSGEAPQTEDK